jgi:hypothetical protein
VAGKPVPHVGEVEPVTLANDANDGVEYVGALVEFSTGAGRTNNAKASAVSTAAST